MTSPLATTVDRGHYHPSLGTRVECPLAFFLLSGLGAVPVLVFSKPQTCSFYGTELSMGNKLFFWSVPVALGEI